MAKRRTDKNGVVLKRGESQRKADGTYRFVKTVRGQTYEVTAKTLTELRNLEKQIERDLADGMNVKDSGKTLNEWFDAYYVKDAETRIRDTTLRNNIYMYDTYARGTIGKLPIKRIDEVELGSFYFKLMKDKHLKVNTIGVLHTPIKQTLAIAVKKDALRHNKADGVYSKLCRNVQGKMRHETTVRALDRWERAEFFGWLRDHEPAWYGLFTFMAYTGLRVGEFCALQPEDIDMERRRVCISKTLVSAQRVGAQLAIHKPKTEEGKREVYLFDEAIEGMQNALAYQSANGITCSAEVDGYSDFLFLNRHGAPYHQSTCNRALKRIVQRYNADALSRDPSARLLPNIHCHMLRHTYATMLMEKGIDKNVARQMLGHVDDSMLNLVYQDVQEDFIAEEMRKFHAVP